jgi:anti-anti-sigma factor
VNSPRVHTPFVINVRVSAEPGGDLVVTLAGEIDRLTSTDVQRAVSQILDDNEAGRVSLDMERVTFLDSSGLRSLLTCHQQALEQGVLLRISRAHDMVYQVLAITDLLELFALARRDPASGPPAPGYRLRHSPGRRPSPSEPTRRPG